MIYMRKSVLLLAAFLIFAAVVAGQTTTHDLHMQIHEQNMQTHIQLHDQHLTAHRQMSEQHQQLHNEAFEKFSKERQTRSGRGGILLYRSGNQRLKLVEGNHPAARYTGRILDNGDGSVSFDWSGTYLEVAFTGGYLAIRVSDTKKNYYNLFVNGKQQGVVTTFGKDSLIVIAKGLGKKQNIVRLQKRTEAEQGKTTIHAFELAAKGDLVPYDPGRTRHIEFIGNSITAGFGTEGLSKDEPFKPETENCNLAFGAIISRYFNSDYTFIAHSGWGAARNYGDTARVSKTSMKDRMMQTFDMYPQPQWSFIGYTPDLVVINLGSNDFSTKPHPLKEEFMAAYDIIIKNIRTKYGNIPVLCVAPPLRGMAFEYIKEYCDNANDPKLFFTAYLAGVHNRDSDLGSVGHPNYNGQRKIAQNLIPYISTITGWPLENKPVK